MAQSISVPATSGTTYTFESTTDATTITLTDDYFALVTAIERLTNAVKRLTEVIK